MPLTLEGEDRGAAVHPTPPDGLLAPMVGEYVGPAGMRQICCECLMKTSGIVPNQMEFQVLSQAELSSRPWGGRGY